MELQTNLTIPGYPEALIHIPLTELCKLKAKFKNSEILAFVSTFNPRYPNLVLVTKKSFLLLNASQKLQEVLKQVRLIIDKSEIQIYSTIINDKTIKKCNDKKCFLCPLIATTNTIIFKYGESLFMIKSNTDCIV